MNKVRGFKSIDMDTKGYHGSSLVFENDIKARRYNQRVKYDFLKEKVIERMTKKNENET